MNHNHDDADHPPGHSSPHQTDRYHLVLCSRPSKIESNILFPSQLNTSPDSPFPSAERIDDVGWEAGAPRECPRGIRLDFSPAELRKKRLSVEGLETPAGAGPEGHRRLAAE